MNILVTGGFGYIGGALVPYLRGRGHHVGVVARGVPSWADTRGLDVYLHDITEPAAFALREPYDVLVHLAAANDIDSRNPATALAATTLGTRQCLDLCVRAGIPRFVYFSTFQVYGADSGAVSESTPLRPRNDYAVTHMFAEEYVRLYQREHGLEFAIVRPMNIYGPPPHPSVDRWSLVPNCFCKEAFETQTITLKTSGRQLKDFISLDDLSALTERLCVSFDAFRNGTVNLVSGRTVSILETATVVKTVYEQMFGRSCELRILSSEPSRVDALTIDTTKIAALEHVPSAEHTMARDVRAIFELLTGVSDGSD